MSALESLMAGPVKIADDLFNSGKMLLIIFGIIAAIIYFYLK